jgi:hypothetical protein
LPGVVKGLRDGCSGDAERCAELEKIESYVLESMAQDFERYEPGLVLVDLKAKEDPRDLYDNISFDLLGFFVDGSPRFAKIWERYELVDKITFDATFTSKKRTFEIWVQRSKAEYEPAQSKLGTAVPTGLRVTR